MMTTKRLLDVCDFQGGTQPPKDEWINDPREGYVRMLQIRDYSQGDAKFIQYVKDTKKLHKCTKDDIMLSRYGYIGQAFIGLEGAYNVALVKVIKKAEIHTPYLLCYFQSYYFQHFLLSNVGARATIPGFNKDELENALIRIPEMCEQIEIASKITKVDKLIGFHKQQLNVLDTLIKSRFIEMFGTLSSNEQNFEVLTIESLCSLIKDGTHQTPTYTEDTIDGFKFLSSKDVMSTKIDWSDIKYIPLDLHEKLYAVVKPIKNDILMSKNGVNYGVAAVNDTDEVFDIYVSLALLRPKTDIINPVYFRSAINSPDTKRQFDSSIKGIGVPNLHLGEIKKTKILVPPVDKQNEYVSFVEQVDKSKFYIVQMQILLRLLIRAIQQKTTEVLL